MLQHRWAKAAHSGEDRCFLFCCKQIACELGVFKSLVNNGEDESVYAGFVRLGFPGGRRLPLMRLFFLSSDDVCMRRNPFTFILSFLAISG